MRRFYLSSSLLLLFTCLGTVKAATIAPYKLNFNVEIATTDHQFKAGTGWGHIADSYDGGYPRYTWHADGGIDNSACLEVGSQTLIDWDDYSSHIVYDMLVTPAVGGKVSLYAKQSVKISSDPGVRFYRVTEEGGILKAGEEIVPTTYGISFTEYTKIELPAQPAGTRIGIRGYQVLMDNFEAETAEVDVAKKLKITSVEWAGPKYNDYDANGNLKVAYRVVVTNIGDVTLTPGTEGYSLTLLRNVFNTIYADMPIQQTIQPGNSSTPILVEATLKKQQLNAKRIFLNLKENITGAMQALPEIEPNDYAPNFSLTGAYGKTPLRTGYRIEYGTARDSVKVDFFLRNTGPLPQKLTELSATAGFASSLQGPLVVAPHDSIRMTLSMTPDTKGEKHGHFTVKGENGVDIVLDLNGYSVADDEWFTGFENEHKPVGFQPEKGWYMSNFPELIHSIANHACMECSTQEPSKLVSPLVEVRTSEKLTIEVSKKNTASFMKVYYSADRKNWTQAAHFTHQQMSDSVLSKSWLHDNYAFTKFTINNIPAGRWYIAFESGVTYLDNIVGYHLVGAEHDAYVSKSNIPVKAAVNSPIEVSATLNNITTNTDPAGDYTFALYFDNKLMVEAEPAELAPLWERTVKKTFTPHEAGTYSAYWKYKHGDTEVTSDTVQVVVEPESMYQIKATGDRLWSFELAPVHLYNFLSESECIYTADELKLKPGTPIKQLIYRGYNTSIDLNVDLTVWMQNTDDNVFVAPYAFTAGEQMEKVFDGMMPIRKVGTQEMQDDVMVIYLEKPFIYTGGNLRIRMTHSSRTYSARVYFDAQNTDSRCIARAGDKDLEQVVTYGYKLPVLRVGTDAATTTVSGKVTNKSGKPIKGATVKLKSDDVEYTATTDASGHYQLLVIKTYLKYDALFAADGVETETVPVELTGSQVTLDHTMGTATAIETVETEKTKIVGYFTIDGRQLTAPIRGINIVKYSDGTSRKIIVK